MRRHALPLAAIFLLLLISTHFTQAQSDIIFEKSLSVDQDGTNADPSAIVHIKATNKGVLIPKVALEHSKDNSTINSPVEGLLVYNIAEMNDVVPDFYYWKDGCWNRVGTALWVKNGDKIYYPYGAVGIGYIEDPQGGLHVYQLKDDAVANFVHDNDTSHASGVDITTNHKGASLLVYQTGSGQGINIMMSNDTSDEQGLNISSVSNSSAASIGVNNQISPHAHALAIGTNSLGRGVEVYHDGSGIGFLGHMTNDTSHSTGFGIISDSRGSGAFINMTNNENNGAYYRNGLNVNHDGMGHGVDIHMANDTTY